MAGSKTLKLRRLWLQFHKWIGILLTVLLIPLGLSGSALVWDEQLDTLLYPQRHVSSADSQGDRPSLYIEKVKPQLGADDRIALLQFGPEGAPILIGAVRAPAEGTAQQARPLRTTLWLKRDTADVLDKWVGQSGILRQLHIIHGSLMIPGMGRQVVGWLGVAMLISSLTGLWLWWPTVGQWTRGLRWRRSRDFDTNAHHMAGFWIAVPLAMLSLTGVWISFPATFNALSGERGRGGNREAMMRAVPLGTPHLAADHVLALAQPGAQNAKPTSIAWPTDQAPRWTVRFSNDMAWNVDDASGAVTPDSTPSFEDAYPAASTMRHMHDGTGMGMLWRVIITLGGLAPALLGVTGILMWLRTRKWRERPVQRRPEPSAA